MPFNHFEQLVCEWYEYQGYLVRRNVRVGIPMGGGSGRELDCVAFHPKHKHLIHAEVGWDFDSYADRDRRYTTKFEAGRQYARAVFDGLPLPDILDQVAFQVQGSRGISTLGGSPVILLSELLKRITDELVNRSIMNSVVPEGMPLLRTIHVMTEYRSLLFT